MKVVGWHDGPLRLVDALAAAQTSEVLELQVLTAGVASIRAGLDGGAWRGRAHWTVSKQEVTASTREGSYGVFGDRFTKYYVLNNLSSVFLRATLLPFPSDKI